MASQTLADTATKATHMRVCTLWPT